MKRFLMTAGGGASTVDMAASPRAAIIEANNASLEVGRLALLYQDGNDLKIIRKAAASPAAADEIVYSSVTGKRLQLVLPRTTENGGPLILPIYRNNLKHTVMAYTAGANYAGTLNVDDIDVEHGNYTIIVCKKGVKFNERNKWIAQIYANRNTTLATIVTELTKQINSNTPNHGLTATATTTSGSEAIDFAGSDWNDYEIILTDNFSGVSYTPTTHGKTPIADAAMVNDIARKCAADAGIRDTELDAAQLIYKDYPFNALLGANIADPKFDIHIIEFDEPRAVGTTTEENVKQTIYIACPRYSDSGTPTETKLSADFTTIMDYYVTH